MDYVSILRSNLFSNGSEVISKIGLFEFEMEKEPTMYDVDKISI